MKKLLITGLMGLLIVIFDITGYSQGTFPQGFNYQAIARNSSGSAIINTDMKVKIGILSDTTLNTIVWEEEHSVRTNGYGLFSLVVGGPKGTRTGGSATTFNLIDWAATQMFIYVQIKNPATAANYTPMGKAKLWSVPYALLSGKSQKDLSSPFLSNGDTVYLAKSFAIGTDQPHKARLAVVSGDDNSDDPLFEVRRKDGQPVFTVYSDAVNINVPYNGKKGTPSRGGFAVGGFDESKGTYVSDLLRVTPDSVRIYVNNNPATGKASPSRGGFAVGGFDQAKSSHTELFRVTHDSTRVYTNESSDKGFAVGYLTTTAVRSDNFMKLNKSNYFIGHQSGAKITTGISNTFLGYQSGFSITSGSNNVFIGQQTGYYTTEGLRNVFIGYRAGYSNVGQASSGTIGHDNIYIGTFSGRDIVSGEHNTLIGNYSGYAGSGTKNTFLGAFTGFFATGMGNVFIGVDAGRYNNAGDHNVLLGAIAGNYNSGSNNTYLGYGAGYTAAASTASGNVFVGTFAGYGQTGSNMLYIDNSSTSTPLIYGDFANDRLALYGNVGINRSPYSTVSLGVSPNGQYYGIWVDAGSTGYAAYFNGDVRTTGTYLSSDLRMKKNIEAIKSPLEKILELNGVSFDWDAEAFPDKGFGKEHQIGLIAQDVEKVFPELVKEDMDGYKAVSYEKLVPVLIEATKEQQAIINKQQATINDLTERLKKVEELLNNLTKK